eukprot:41731-Chlamydomonas_euryale.AAC.1
MPHQNCSRPQSCHVHDYDQSVAKQRLAYVQFPIGELEAPHDFGAGAALVEDLAARVAAGEVVAMHCRCGQLCAAAADDGSWGCGCGCL